MGRSGNHAVLALITGPLLFALYACGNILGITDGTAREDAGLDAPTEATTGDEQPVAIDAGADTAACVSKDVCVDHCGLTLDECGVTVKCPNECGDGKQCNAATHVCECVSNPNWCTGRCGSTKDNCKKDVTCGGCPGAQACDNVTNSCGGCIPDNVTACAGKNCGSATNNCGQLTDCGACSGQCNNGTCCIPSPVCTGKSCGSFDNGCNQTVACGANGGGCAAGGLCNNTTYTCCYDDGQACTGKGCGTVTNNCGVPKQCANQCTSSQTCGTTSDPNACCTPTCAGKQCTATNGCAGGSLCSGVTCTSSTQCCSGESCRTNFPGGKCAPGTCAGSGAACSGANGCCYPLSCIATAGGPDGGTGDGGFTATCQ